MIDFQILVKKLKFRGNDVNVNIKEKGKNINIKEKCKNIKITSL